MTRLHNHNRTSSGYSWTSVSKRQHVRFVRLCSMSIVVSGALTLVPGPGAIKAIAQDTHGIADQHPITEQPVSKQTEVSSQGVRNTAIVILFVNPTIGNDAMGNGSQRLPFRTLTHALNLAQPGTTIMLSPGIYGHETGEQFPLRLAPGITVYGNPSTQGNGILIRGGGDFISPTATRQNIAILGANDAILTGVTVTNPNHRGYGVWVESSNLTISGSTLTGNRHDGISVNGTSAPLIQGNRFYGNHANGISVFGRSHPRIDGNRFEQTGYGINVGDAASPIITNNHIVQNRSGIVVQEQAHVIVRQNVITYNQQHGVVAIAQAQVDLGTPDSPGQNEFLNNGQSDINASVSDDPVVAVGNSPHPVRVIGTVDFAAQSSTLIRVSPPEPDRSPTLTAPVEIPVQHSAIGGSSVASETQVEPRSPVRILRSPSTRPTEILTVIRPDARAIAQSVDSSSADASLQQHAVSSQNQPQPEQEFDTNLPRLLEQTAGVEEQPESTPSRSQPSQHRLVRPEHSSTISDSEGVPIQVMSPISDGSNDEQGQPDLAMQSPSVRSQSNHVNAPVALRISYPNPVEHSTQTTHVQTSRLINPVAIQATTSTIHESTVEISRERSGTELETLSAPQATIALPSTHLLQVPDADVPHGHVGDVARISVEENPLHHHLGSAVRQESRPLQYRVMVDPSQQPGDMVQSLVPGAFYTRLNGRSLLQVGAFADAANASELADRLAIIGIRSEIYPIEN